MMELSQVLQLAGAFLGGGIGGAYLESLWSDRNARRSFLRPKDSERIDRVRERARLIYQRQVQAAHGAIDLAGLSRMLDDLYSPTEDESDTDIVEVVQELDDDILEAYWEWFHHLSETYADDYRKAWNLNDSKATSKVFRAFYEANDNLMKRLNELERKR